jgi:FMN phosphatase YigB (HAD superfamily)/DNA-binding XRE family transcriptional regulator
MSPLDEKGLGARLQMARREASLTQQELCHKANLSYSTLAKIERGAIKSPSIFTIQSIAAALDTTLDALLGGTLNAGGRTLHKTKSGVSFIYFDVNGCLVRFYQRAFARIAEDNGVPADVVEMAYLHYNDDACRGRLTMADFNHEMAQRIGVNTIDWASYYLAAADPVTDMHELLVWTAENYKVGLLTNIMPGLLGSLRSASKVPNVKYDAVVDSSEVGTIKPESTIFEIAAERANLAPAEILLIDDTQGNLSAAEKLGWHVLRFDYAQPEESAANIRAALEPATSS